ncbi:hypothetical protein Micbo1qcDRAFT_168895, partial [Microdochium bolleyi]
MVIHPLLIFVLIHAAVEREFPRMIKRCAGSESGPIPNQEAFNSILKVVFVWWPVMAFPSSSRYHAIRDGVFVIAAQDD